MSSMMVAPRARPRECERRVQFGSQERRTVSLGWSICHQLSLTPIYSTTVACSGCFMGDNDSTLGGTCPKLTDTGIHGGCGGSERRSAGKLKSMLIQQLLLRGKARNSSARQWRSIVVRDTQCAWHIGETRTHGMSRYCLRRDTSGALDEGTEPSNN
jgi:hypothetical protein